MTCQELERKVREARKLIVETNIAAGVGHIGGSLSSADVMTALYFDVLRLDPNNPGWEGRDRFILSKGHCALGLYSQLCLKGFISKEMLLTYRQNGSLLSGHPDMRKVSFVEMSTGSLGQGLSVGVGMALAGRLDRKDYRVFVLQGDGECQEGSVWEAAMSAGHFQLDTLTAIIDRNGIQIDGCTEDVMRLEPLADRWRAFGWEVREIDGHSMAETVTTLRAVPFSAGKPSLVISHTVKGKGVSFMENNRAWHSGAPKGELAEQAIREVEAALATE